MYKLKSDIIHALTCGDCDVSTNKLVEVSDILDAHTKLVEEKLTTTNKAITKLINIDELKSKVGELYEGGLSVEQCATVSDAYDIIVNQLSQ